MDHGNILFLWWWVETWHDSRRENHVGCYSIFGDELWRIYILISWLDTTVYLLLSYFVHLTPLHKVCEWKICMVEARIHVSNFLESLKQHFIPRVKRSENSKLVSITCKPESQSEKSFQSRATRDAGASGGNFLTLVFFYEKENKTTRLLELREKANFSLLSSF